MKATEIAPEKKPVSKKGLNLPLLYITSVLKFFSSDNKPLSVPEIAEKLAAISPELNIQQNSIEKSISRTLHKYFDSYDPASDDFHSNILSLILGGRIEIARSELTTSKNSKKKSKTKKYFFHPFLDQADLSLIKSSLITNRSLSDKERTFLLACTELLLAPRERFSSQTTDSNSLNLVELSNTVQNILSEIVGPDSNPRDLVQALHTKNLKKGSSLLADRNFLNHTNLLYDAIHHKKMIEVTYGKYSITGTGKLSFESNSTGKKTSILNPYALMWGNGHLYLIATHENYTNPVHYRVDRIIDVQINKSDRNPVPKELEPYQLTNGEFDSAKYISEHPLMGAYYSDAKKIDCTLTTTEKGLGLLYDYFGNSITITALEGKTDDSNINHTPLTLYEVNLHNVYDDNLLLFCTQHHGMLTIKSPENLRQKVIENLTRSINKLKADN